MLLIPAIDLRGGAVVRLRQGSFQEETRYGSTPVELVNSWLEQGATWVHMVDLDGARSGRPVNTELIRSVAENTKAHLQTGGGVRSLEHASWLLDCGVKRVVFGTRIATDLAFAKQALSELGDAAVVGVDARDGIVAIAGWTESTTQSALDLGKRLADLGARRFVFTDIATDGMLNGPNLEALAEFAEAVGVPVIASGGVSSVTDIQEVAQIPGVESAIVGRALIEGRLDLKEALAAATNAPALK
jgi:phosphoribosylformimino-5-aminoimidazole carboxamide ribotide isomerase